MCFPGQTIRTTITPLDCIPASGPVGDAARVQSSCSDALDGQSGESCLGPFSCGRIAMEPCCVDFALCKAESTLLQRYRLCPDVCLAPITTNVAVSSCHYLESLLQLDAGVSAWLGTPCTGDFTCPRTSLAVTATDATPGQEDLYYCANGALQRVSLSIPAL